MRAFLRWYYPGQVLWVGGALSRPLSPVARAPHTLPRIVAPAPFVARLEAARIGATFNQYRRSRLRRERLIAYLESRSHAPVLLVGEAPGYRGARVSGIPFTSERQLTGSGPAEATATVVHRASASWAWGQ